MSGYQRGEGWGLGQIGEGDKEGKISSYKISKPWGCHVQPEEYGQ